MARRRWLVINDASNIEQQQYQYPSTQPRAVMLIVPPKPVMLTAAVSNDLEAGPYQLFVHIPDVIRSYINDNSYSCTFQMSFKRLSTSIVLVHSRCLTTVYTSRILAHSSSLSNVYVLFAHSRFTLANINYMNCSCTFQIPYKRIYIKKSCTFP